MSDAAGLCDALEATWPPAETVDLGGWRIRRGLGGGSRVSSVRPMGDPGRPLDDAIAEAERIMRSWGQRALFQLTDLDGALERELAARDYGVKDPTVFMEAAIAGLAERDPTPVRPVEAQAPLAAMEAVWKFDRVGPARLAVMARATDPKTHLALRVGDMIAGVAFVGVSGGVAMLHALVVAPSYRRRGIGRAGVVAAARYGARHGAGALALAVTEANGAAQALYRDMGFEFRGGYRYLAAPSQ